VNDDTPASGKTAAIDLRNKYYAQLAIVQTVCAMPKDPFIREKFTRVRTAAGKLANGDPCATD
jgi:hypothetical protein